MANEDAAVDRDLLRQLAWASTVAHDGDDERVARDRIAWLQAVSPDQWHSFAIGFNWGDPLDPLEWIVRQDQCDLATALTIFWRAEPGWDLMLLARGEPASDRPERALVDYIAGRIARGGYPRRRIAWDPQPAMRSDYQEMKRHVAAIDNPLWVPHRDMLRPVHGREIADSPAAWEARPDGVRTGFWLDLPPCDVVTPNMADCREKLQTVLFYLFAAGAGAHLLAGFSRDPAAHRWAIAALVGLTCWWIYRIRQDSSIIRSLIREDLKPVPMRQGLALYAAVFAVGVMALPLYRMALPVVAGGSHRLVQIGVAGTGCLLIWYALGRFARLVTYRYLFR